MRVNAAAIEIARILLEYEVQRIQRERKAAREAQAAADVTGQDDASAATSPQQSAGQKESTLPAGAAQIEKQTDDPSL